MLSWGISDEAIRQRSYLIWEREGRPRGHDREYWWRAEVELEAECQAAVDGRTTRYVLPHLKISMLPLRRGDTATGKETTQIDAASSIPRHHANLPRTHKRLVRS
ncbi:MAG: DUF2934 domain-containing protein [Alphaproteobacteria bacterium]|nr:DUF2934 domain-containing protein [Alphaproteobacteria bacterium]MDE2494672.1 DUF2934 domain-containing protein [Alphaproteobacteria bacterium]